MYIFYIVYTVYICIFVVYASLDLYSLQIYIYTYLHTYRHTWSMNGNQYPIPFSSPQHFAFQAPGRELRRCAGRSQDLGISTVAVGVEDSNGFFCFVDFSDRKTYLDIFIKQKDIFIKGKLIDIKNYKTCFEEILQTPVAGCP